MKRARGVAARIALIVGGLLIVLGALELALRAWPTMLGPAFANGARSKYTSRPGGIYYHDPRLNIHFMIPNHRTTMYYNGYVWHHETDAFGFRNRELHVPADVMLVGDSVVYGHGVEFEDTVGHNVEERSGLRVVNLGRQGDCAFQEAYLVGAYVPVFTPRHVVHVFAPNDIEDVYLWLSDAAMRAFISEPVDRIAYPPRTDPATLMAARERKIRERSLGRWVEQELYLAKMLRWLRSRFEGARLASVVAPAEAAPARERRLDDGRAALTDAASLGWRYTEHALEYMQYAAAKVGGRLLMAPLVQGEQMDILRRIAARHGIDLVDTAPLFEARSFLPNDGHLSPEGSRLMAELIVARLRQGRQ